MDLLIFYVRLFSSRSKRIAVADCRGEFCYRASFGAGTSCQHGAHIYVVTVADGYGTVDPAVGD